ISHEIKQGFPHAPLGCRIELSKQTQELILNNIRQATLNTARLVGLIRRFSQDCDLPLTLANFLRFYPHITLEEVYKRGNWSALVKQAYNHTVSEFTDDKLHSLYTRAINTRLLGCDALHYLQFLQELVAGHFAPPSEQDERMALMCHYDFWQQSGPKAGFVTLAQSLKRLEHPELRVELADLLALLINRVQHEQLAMPHLPGNPLRLHARYAREQILVGFGATRFAQQPSAREGVFVIAEQNIELLFVTLNKTEKHFSPTTRYHDYAISESLFHWQSQNSARPDRGKGLSYIEQKEKGKRLFLFVREQNSDEFGRTLGFVNFGEVEYVSHSGSQPMNIKWRLMTPMPPFMWKEVAKLAVG
ncbi:MAG: DUF3427 domain-containing protein, partial [Aeromonas sp.]|nr:DUF3427 domain-containing protein [Aeromonas sp.]